jgi:DNA-binding IclR family transcriptional regulator
MLLVRDEIRFVATVESDQVLRVGDRAGRVLPAHLASGGKAMLATMTAPELKQLYASREDVDLPRLDASCPRCANAASPSTTSRPRPD